MDPGQTTKKQATAICPFYALSWKDITLQVFVSSGLAWLYPQLGIYPKVTPGKLSRDFSLQDLNLSQLSLDFFPLYLSTYWFGCCFFFKPFNFPLCGHIFRKTWLHLVSHQNRLLTATFSEGATLPLRMNPCLLLFFLQVATLVKSLTISLFKQSINDVLDVSLGISKSIISGACV